MEKISSTISGSSATAPSFLIQRLHPNLRIGDVPSVMHGKRHMRIFVQQDFWSSACGAHCVAIAMAMLGEIKNVETVSERKYGAAGRLWKAAQAMYFDGATPQQLLEMIQTMRTGRRIALCTGLHAECLDFTLDQLSKGNVVIASWHSRRGKQHHWIVIVGIEGFQTGHSFTPTTLLGIDPSLDEPYLSAANCRIEFTDHPVVRSNRYVRYRCSDGSKLTVTLTSALSLETAKSITA
jgi:hypothetical protein